MRVSLLVGSTVYPLAGQAGVSERVHSSAADFQLSGQAAKQIIQRIRGQYVQIVDRGNLMHTVRFTTTRQLATPAEAFLAVLDHDGLTPRAGTLVLDAVAPGGGIYRRLMASAVITPPARRIIGATAFYEYSVDGGQITDGGYIPAGATGNMLVTGSLTSNGSTPMVFPLMILTATENGRPIYSDSGDLVSGNFYLGWDAAPYNRWALISNDPPANWHSSSDVASPDLATGWTPAALSGSTATGTPIINPETA